MTKSTFLKLLVASLLVCASVTALTACFDAGNGGDSIACNHAYGFMITTDEYLLSEATCTQKAVYYYSCICGKKGTDTFEYGEFKEHDYSSDWAYDEDNHWHECFCGATTQPAEHEYENGECKYCGKSAEHTYDQMITTDEYLLSEATCTKKAVYYYSCICGKKGTDTFEYGEFKEHDYSSDWSYDEDNHWHECFCGATTTPQTHEYENGQCKYCGQKEQSSTVVETEELEYTLNSDNASYSCTGLGTVTATDIVIADVYNGLPVTSIGKSAFDDCIGLTSVVIGNNVTSIGNYTFFYCKGLTSITIPDSVTSISDDAFAYCESLTSITVDKNNRIYCSINNCLIEKENKILVLGCENSVIPTDGSVTSIGNYAFSGCTSLTSVTIPDGVTSIEGYAFENCSSLTSITIPDSVTSIGNSAFSGCTGLTSVTIPDGVTSIARRTFYNCTNLTSVTIPDSVTSISDDAFAYCESLTSITVDKNNRIYCSINNCLIEKESKTLILGCKNSVIPTDGSVTSIGSSAFSGCTGLTSVTIGNSVTSIGDSAFSGCKGLTSITIPDSVTSIDYGAFISCDNLTSIIIPDSVTFIGLQAFYGCGNLAKVYYKGTATKWNNITISWANSYLTDATRYYYSESKPTTSGNYWHYDENGNVAELW